MLALFVLLDDLPVPAVVGSVGVLDCASVVDVLLPYEEDCAAFDVFDAFDAPDAFAAACADEEAAAADEDEAAPLVALLAFCCALLDALESDDCAPMLCCSVCANDCALFAAALAAWRPLLSLLDPPSRELINESGDMLDSVSACIRS